MTKKNTDPVRQANEAGLDAFKALPLEEQVERLKALGVLNERGELARAYGGTAKRSRKSRAA